MSTGTRMTAADANPWVLTPRPSQSARLRLICFPYAGGGPQNFFPWMESFPAGIEFSAVNLPGRGRRFAEPAFKQMPTLVSALADGLSFDNRPFVFFGHSMGAIVAFELARELRRRGKAQPLHFFASGCFPPHVPDPHPIHHLPDAEFLAELRDLGGLPAEVLQSAELLELMLPTVRADFTCTETYAFADGEPLDCDLTAYTGDQDPLATPECVSEWSRYTSGKFILRQFPGGHFFIQERQSEVLQAFAADLRSCLGKC